LHKDWRKKEINEEKLKFPIFGINIRMQIVVNGDEKRRNFGGYGQDRNRYWFLQDSEPAEFLLGKGAQMQGLLRILLRDLSIDDSASISASKLIFKRLENPIILSKHSV
jgi:hypothetical protein